MASMLAMLAAALTLARMASARLLSAGELQPNQLLRTQPIVSAISNELEVELRPELEREPLALPPSTSDHKFAAGKWLPYIYHPMPYFFDPRNPRLPTTPPAPTRNTLREVPTTTGWSTAGDHQLRMPSPPTRHRRPVVSYTSQRHPPVTSQSVENGPYAAQETTVPSPRKIQDSAMAASSNSRQSALSSPALLQEHAAMTSLPSEEHQEAAVSLPRELQQSPSSTSLPSYHTEPATPQPDDRQEMSLPSEPEKESSVSTSPIDPHQPSTAVYPATSSPIDVANRGGRARPAAVVAGVTSLPIESFHQDCGRFRDLPPVYKAGLLQQLKNLLAKVIVPSAPAARGYSSEYLENGNY